MGRIIWGLALACLIFAALSHMNTSAPQTGATQGRAAFGLSAGVAISLMSRDVQDIWIRSPSPQPTRTALGQWQMGDVCCPGIPARVQQNIATGEALN